MRWFPQFGFDVGRSAPIHAWRSARAHELRAAEKPVFGWSGWGRSLTRRYDDPLRKETVTIDSLWIIVFGKHGVAGLASLLLGLGIPVLALWRRCPPLLWYQPSAAWSWALALVLTLYAIDSLVNAMVNPIYLLIAGGLCGLAPARAPAPAPVVRERAAPFAGVFAR